MISEAHVTLPGGLWVGDACQREAELRPLTGTDEAILLDKGTNLSPAQRTTMQITSCLIRLGSIDPVTPSIARSLTVGDREALLLHLRRLTFGDKMQCILNCPSPTCREKMEIDLKVSDLLIPPYADTKAVHETTVTQNNATYRVTFHLPTGGDQEEAGTVAMTSPEAAVDLLIRRCVEKVTTELGEIAELQLPLVADQLSREMFELDPQAELKLDVTCPYCGHSCCAFLDASTFLSQELVAASKHLFKEVHLLAFYYHWSENEILSLTPTRRHRYLDLLDDELKDLRRA